MHRDVTLAIGEGTTWLSYRSLTLPSYALAYKVKAARDEKSQLKPVTVELTVRYHLETDTTSAPNIIRKLVAEQGYTSVDANPAAVRSKRRAPLGSPATETFTFAPSSEGETVVVEPANLIARIREDFVRRD